MFIAPLGLILQAGRTRNDVFALEYYVGVSLYRFAEEELVVQGVRSWRY